VSRYQKGKTSLDFTEARDSEWQWHQLGNMQVCTSLQTDNHASTPLLSFLQTGCPSCRPTNSVKALKAICINKCVNNMYSINKKNYTDQSTEANYLAWFSIATSPPLHSIQLFQIACICPSTYNAESSEQSMIPKNTQYYNHTVQYQCMN